MLLQFTESTFSESDGQIQKPVLQNVPDNPSLWILVSNIPLRDRAPSQSPGRARLLRDTHLSRHWLPWPFGIMETLNGFYTFAQFTTWSFQPPTFSRALQTRDRIWQCSVCWWRSVWASMEERKDECLVYGARIHIMNFRFLIGFGRQITIIPMNNHVCYANWLLCAGLSRIIVLNYNSYLLPANQFSYLVHPWEASPCCSRLCVWRTCAFWLNELWSELASPRTGGSTILSGNVLGPGSLLLLHAEVWRAESSRVSQLVEKASRMEQVEDN